MVEADLHSRSIPLPAHGIAAQFILPRKRISGDLGHHRACSHGEGKSVAVGLGVKLYEDPWEMNKVGAQTDHLPSCCMTSGHKLKTEIDFLGRAIARGAARAGIPAPLHTALYRLIKAKRNRGRTRVSGYPAAK